MTSLAPNDIPHPAGCLPFLQCGWNPANFVSIHQTKYAMRNSLRFWLTGISILAVGLSFSFAQSDKALLRELAQDNKKSIEALVLYPEDDRLAILEATRHPEVLIKIKSLQNKTSAAFRTLIEDYPQTTQSLFFDFSRYPGLIENVVARHDDRNEVRRLVQVFPADDRDDAVDLVGRHWMTFARINELNQTTQRAFDALVATYPTTAQQAFRRLLDLPEVVDILNEDMRFTVLVGDVYHDDPAWVIHKMDSLNRAVARDHAQELDNWKQTLEQDPQTRDEMTAAAHEYADEFGYGWSDRPNPDAYDPYPYYHYPYWFGYPWWEPYPHWWPTPYWWNWGCSFYPNSIVVVYLPSYHFMHWYFDHPRHHEHYNHLSAQFINHYNGYRRSGTSISMGVGEWHNRNREVVSESFLQDKSHLPDRLKSYGKFETGRQEFNKKNPGREMAPEAYLDKNSRKFPDLKQSRDQARDEIERGRKQETDRRSDWAPKKEPIQRETEPARVPRPERPAQLPQNPAQPPRQPDVNRPKPTEARPHNEIDQAKDYHRQQWETNKRMDAPRQQPQVQPRQQTAPQSSPRQQSSPQAQPRQSAGAKPGGRKG
jgi:hypothetical protein